MAIVICCVIIPVRDFSDRALNQWSTGVDECICMVRQVLFLLQEHKWFLSSGWCAQCSVVPSGAAVLWDQLCLGDRCFQPSKTEEEAG